MLHFLLTHAYQAMIPLALFEGPIVAVASGAGVATGKINPVYAALIIAFGALFQDTLYYWIGRWTESKPGVRAFAKRARLLRDTVQPLKDAWHHDFFLTVVTSKFAYGLYAPILVTAGMAGLPFGRFLMLSLAVSAVVLGAWFGAGFGLERLNDSLGDMKFTPYITAGLGLIGLIALGYVGIRARKRLKHGH